MTEKFRTCGSCFFWGLDGEISTQNKSCVVNPPAALLVGPGQIAACFPSTPKNWRCGKYDQRLGGFSNPSSEFTPLKGN